MPTPLLSFRAPAAAAEAYLRGAVTGGGAGFMFVSFGIGGGGGIEFSVARAGNGDLSCVEGRRTATGGSGLFLRVGPGVGSGSGGSSANDWAS